VYKHLLWYAIYEKNVHLISTKLGKEISSKGYLKVFLYIYMYTIYALYLLRKIDLFVKNWPFYEMETAFSHSAKYKNISH